MTAFFQSKEKMKRGSRRGCIRLKRAIIGIDDEDDCTFTIRVDNRIFHFQGLDLSLFHTHTHTHTYTNSHTHAHTPTNAHQLDMFTCIHFPPYASAMHIHTNAQAGSHLEGFQSQFDLSFCSSKLRWERALGSFTGVLYQTTASTSAGIHTHTPSTHTFTHSLTLMLIHTYSLSLFLAHTHIHTLIHTFTHAFTCTCSFVNLHYLSVCFFNCSFRYSAVTPNFTGMQNHTHTHTHTLTTTPCTCTHSHIRSHSYTHPLNHKSNGQQLSQYIIVRHCFGGFYAI